MSVDLRKGLDLVDVPQKVTDAIAAKVHSDLTPGMSLVFKKTGFAVTVGGLMSMALCGQFGLGFTSFASNFSHVLHRSSGALICGLVCGGLFAVVPLALLRLMCSGMQFRAMMRQYWQVPLLLMAIAGGLLSFHGNFGFEFVSFLSWICGALTCYQLLGMVVDKAYFRYIKPSLQLGQDF